MASRKAAIAGKPSGLPYAKMNAEAARGSGRTGRRVRQRFSAHHRRSAHGAVSQEPESGLYFAWAGGIEKGNPHYYRIQTPTFLIEYDDTQNEANHIHSVWRDYEGDFGVDLLADHYQSSHKH